MPVRSAGGPRPRDGDVTGARVVEDDQRVPYDLVDVRVPGDAGDRAQVETRVPDGEQQRQGVVDPVSQSMITGMG